MIRFHFNDGKIYETAQVNGTYDELFTLLSKGQKLNAPFEEIDIEGRRLDKTVNDIEKVEITLA
ncbi:hypothetical protein [Sinobaca sp. H24]|uniref:hypothetical protein n=1 Tax=Sinobaca sp. H24 TaxID=2923376 RepID=UPI00207AEA26|nr:hypothetical protein [Sinobaca sp. H24]